MTWGGQSFVLYFASNQKILSQPVHSKFVTYNREMGKYLAYP